MKWIKIIAIVLLVDSSIIFYWFRLYVQGWVEVSDRFSNRCGLKLVHATPIKFQTLDYQRVLCLFWKFEAFILKQNWFMIKNRIYFLFQKIEFSTLNFFKENQIIEFHSNWNILCKIIIFKWSANLIKVAFLIFYQFGFLWNSKFMAWSKFTLLLV